MSGRRFTPAGTAIVLALALLSAPGFAQTSLDKELGEIRDYLSQLETLGFAGVVAVSLEGRPVLVEGYGLADREHGIAWTPATVSTIGSLTKQFTGATLLLLQEQDLLSVEDPLGKYFDAVPDDKQSITLHHLLTHSSGIVDLDDAGDFDPIGREEFVERILKQPLESLPGEHYQYSNAGYSLLGAVIESVCDLCHRIAYIVGLGGYQQVRDRRVIASGRYAQQSFLAGTIVLHDNGGAALSRCIA